MEMGRLVDLAAQETSVRQERLSQSHPAVFAELVNHYRQAVDEGLEALVQQSTSNRSAAARLIASGLASLGATAKDTLEVHLETLRRMDPQCPPARLAAVMAESRLILLEVMGLLANAYRERALARDSAPRIPEVERLRVVGGLG